VADSREFPGIPERNGLGLRGYSRSKSKVVRNCAEFWTFYRPPKFFFFGGGTPSKSYTHVMTPASRHVVWKMFCECEDTPTIAAEVIRANPANTLNFKPNFKFSRLKFFGDPVSVRVCASKACLICSASENFRAQHPPPLRAKI